MHTVNERVIAAPAATVGVLLDRLASADDLLWPASTWPALRLDRPLGVGADGGHGPVRYAVTAYEPGRRARFSFTPRFTIDGYHELTVVPIDDDQCWLRDVLTGRPVGSMRLAWPIVWRWLHDALMEDLIDRAEAAATGHVTQRARWSPWVRLLRRLLAPTPRAVPIPPDAALLRDAFAERLARVEDGDLVDAWTVRRAPGVTSDPTDWADAMFRDPPRWVAAALGLRNALVGLVGIDRGDVCRRSTRVRSPRQRFCLGRTRAIWTSARPCSSRGRPSRCPRWRACITGAAGYISCSSGWDIPSWCARCWPVPTAACQPAPLQSSRPHT